MIIWNLLFVKCAFIGRSHRTSFHNNFYSFENMWKIGIIFILFPAAIHCLECYVCENQDSNYDKCVKTIKTCEIDEDRCMSEIRWGSTPYWDFTGKKQFYISKQCATERDCKDSIHSVSKRCDRIWYNDWECVECCHGDRCNYFVTLAGVSMKPQAIFYILVTFVWLFLLQKVF